MRSEQNLLLERPPESFASCVAALAEAQSAGLLETLGQIANINDTERLHDGRISGKRLRYLLEPIRPYVNEAQQVVRQSKKLQDLLGDLNDIHVLMREIDDALAGSTQQRGDRVRASLRGGDIDRARREASMSEWTGFIELHARLDQERRVLVAKLRDRWLGSELEALVGQARDLAQQLRSMEQLG